nr:hypothetical protein [uncultured Sphingomonas sp.]
MTARQLRTGGLVVIFLGAWLILSPRMNGPATIADVPTQYLGWPILMIGWLILLRAMNARRSDDG